MKEYRNKYNSNLFGQDECPMAYKPIESILANISPTVEVVNVIKPTYNFKASD